MYKIWKPVTLHEFYNGLYEVSNYGEISKMYLVGEAAISDIKRRKTWKHI